jgi:manganese transport protein
VANVTGLFFQTLAAKLGVATGRDLMQLCRAKYSRPVTLGLWAQAEIVAVATDLAEIIGGAVALHLLLGVPLLAGGTITAILSFALLFFDRRGHRRFDGIVAGALLGIAAGMLCCTVASSPRFSDLGSGLVPGFADQKSLVLAVGIFGATVMPHAVYLHSARSAERVRMLPRKGAFTECMALLISGLSSSSVGAYAGQAIMAGFLRRYPPLVVRRAMTLIPSILILAIGVDPTSALVWSQVVLSFGLPFALIPLLLFTRDREVMGTLVNRRSTTICGALAGAAVICLNLSLFLP